MDEQRMIGNIPAEEFEQIVDRFIEQTTAWDGALPMEDFFEAWEVLADEDTPLEVQAVIVDNELLLDPPGESAHSTRQPHSSCDPRLSLR